jgi:hypothetical protein
MVVTDTMTSQDLAPHDAPLAPLVFVAEYTQDPFTTQPIQLATEPAQPSSPEPKAADVPCTPPASSPVGLPSPPHSVPPRPVSVSYPSDQPVQVAIPDSLPSTPTPAAQPVRALSLTGAFPAPLTLKRPREEDGEEPLTEDIPVVKRARRIVERESWLTTVGKYTVAGLVGGAVTFLGLVLSAPAEGR